MSFTIVADSCCDLPTVLHAASYFRSVPLTIHVAGEDFVDDESLNTELLLLAMERSQEASNTSCPSPADYLDAYRAAEGDIYVVTLSALLSGSHNSAWQAMHLFQEEQPDRNIYVFNSCSASAGEVALARKVAELAESGLPFSEVVRQADHFITGMNTLFVLDNLDNLKKNGRLTKVQALLTGALRIKLVMGSTPEGEICKHGQALSVKQALAKLVDLMSNDDHHRGRVLCISHCQCPDRAAYLKTLALKCCDFQDILITETRGISSYYANTGGVVAAY